MAPVFEETSKLKNFLKLNHLTMAVINPPERKLAKRTSVHLYKIERSSFLRWHYGEFLNIFFCKFEHSAFSMHQVDLCWSLIGWPGGRPQMRFLCKKDNRKADWGPYINNNILWVRVKVYMKSHFPFMNVKAFLINSIQ